MSASAKKQHPPQQHPLQMNINSRAGQRNSSMVGVQQIQHYSGPLPPPEHLERYNLLDPSFAARIIAMAEKEQAQRHDLEQQESRRKNDISKNESIAVEQKGAVLKTESINSRIGLIFAFLTVNVMFLGCVICAIYGASLMAGILGVGGLTSVASVFILGSRIKNSSK